MSVEKIPKSETNEKFVLNSIDDQVEFTIDCSDPAQASNANCLVYSSGQGDISASTNGGQIFTLIILGSLIVAILIGYLIYTIL